jgi:hypothetical protein
MRIGYKILTVFISLITLLSILQVASIGLAEGIPGAHGGP